MGVLFASIGLAYQCLALRDERESRSYADQAMHIAGSMEGRQSLLFAIASLAPACLHLRRWEHLDPLLFEIESAAVPMTDLWTNVKLSQGALLARRGRHQEALAPLSQAVDGSRALQIPRRQGMALREYALSLYASGRADDARACIRSSLHIAESGADLLELRRTYRAASRILRDARMSQRASETGS
jgi:tetratricopeptide (TPR) repeat protein